VVDRDEVVAAARDRVDRRPIDVGIGDEGAGKDQQGLATARSAPSLTVEEATLAALADAYLLAGNAPHARALARETLYNDTPGFVLEILGDAEAGLDFEELRRKLRLYSDSFDYLREFGIPQVIAPPFVVAAVFEVGVDGVRKRVA
jgi:hypothetical protein